MVNHMNFQDQIKASFRDKSEVEAEKEKHALLQAEKDAKETMGFIKNGLLRSSKDGEYSMVNGRKVVSACWQVSGRYMNCIESETKAKYGKTLFGRVVQVEPYRKQHSFHVAEDKKKQFEEFQRIFKKLAEENDITVVRYFIQNTKTKEELCFPSVKEGYIWRFDWMLMVECTTAIPEKYSSDIEVRVTEHLTEDQKEESISIDDLNGYDFEQLCSKLLMKNGFTEVEVTSGSGDQGIDIIAFKSGVKFGIQCKCYTSDIGNKAVQETYAGKTFYKCHVGAVLTNRYFTRSAKDLAESNGIILWDRECLQKLVKGEFDS